MKNIKQIREEFDLITEKEENESKKLNALVRAGLYDAKKLPALKKALEKTPDKMTGQEKRMLVNLLDSLISQVTSDEQVYRKVKQNVQHMNEAKKDDTYSKFDSRVKQDFPTDKDIPTVLILKRKAIRVYPDNQKVALYYSQALDKYVTIPFSDIQTSLNEEQIDEALPLIALGAAALRAAGPSIVRGVGTALRSTAARNIAAGAVTKGRQILSKGKDLGKKVLDKLRLKRSGAPNRGSGPKGRRPKRPRRRDGLDADISLGNLGGGAGTSGQDSSQSPTYSFSGKVQGTSSWGGEQRAASSRTATQDARMKRLNAQALQRNESVISDLKEMVANNIEEKTISINEQEVNINNNVAKKILFVYESINTKNKKKMEKMLNESATSFSKVLTFALRQ